MNFNKLVANVTIPVAVSKLTRLTLVAIVVLGIANQARITGEK